MQIAAAAREIQLVRSVGDPLRLGLLLLAADGGRRRRRDLQRLILEAVGFHLHAALGRDVEDLDLRLRDVGFAGHRVAIRSRASAAGSTAH